VASSAGVVSKAALAQVAADQIAGGDSDLAALVRRLAEANRHEIMKATGGAITFNADGFAQTALGVVQRDSVRMARRHLQVIAAERAFNQLDTASAHESIKSYLQLIPQKVGSRRGWHLELFGTTELINAQYDLLEKLEQSIEQAEKEVQALAKKAADQPQERVFEVKLERMDDAKELKRLRAFFEKSINRAHVTANMRIKAVYKLHIPSMARAFEEDGAKVGNIQELWHGTRTFNVLSILKSGLVIPKSSDGHVTGRMFGDGLYFSDQSSKSLNYSAGFWDQSHNGAYDKRCFMFLADVAMGRAFTPRGTRAYEPPRGYDSVFAQAGVSNVLNNEMIVYRLGQANLKYLIEFEA
jgi:poly [ADP-ribose] polymerase